MFDYMMQKSFFLFYLLLAIISSATAGEIRVKKSFDFDWKFIISDSTTFLLLHFRIQNGAMFNCLMIGI